MLNVEITSGKINNKAQKVVIYGPEGIGKSTFAAHFPNPLFIDTEGSTGELDVRRLPAPTSWQYLMWEIDQVKANPDICSSLIIDTADWAERLCINNLCEKNQVSGIEGFGYGKGYVYLEEEFGRFLNRLSDLIDLGINVVFTAHATMRKFEQPDESGAYDRWELKLQKKDGPLLKEWADMVLFANYETFVVKEGSGDMKKAKAKGGRRVMHTVHHPCWDAKNRKGFPEKAEFDYSVIAAAIPDKSAGRTEMPEPAPPVEDPAAAQAMNEPAAVSQPESQTPQTDPTPTSDGSAKTQLYDLMNAHQVTRNQIQDIVAKKGYFPAKTPIENYPDDFIKGVLVGAWDQVHKAILDEEIPF